MVTDSVKAGSRQKPKTKDGCVIADQGEQDSDTRPGSWVTPLSPSPRMRIRTYKRHNNPPQEAKQRHLMENGAVTLSPAQLGNLALQEPKSHRLLSVWTIKCFTV